MRSLPRAGIAFCLSSIGALACATNRDVDRGRRASVAERATRSPSDASEEIGSRSTVARGRQVVDIATDGRVVFVITNALEREAGTPATEDASAYSGWCSPGRSIVSAPLPLGADSRWTEVVAPSRCDQDRPLLDVGRIGDALAIRTCSLTRGTSGARAGWTLDCVVHWADQSRPDLAFVADPNYDGHDVSMAIACSGSSCVVALGIASDRDDAVGTWWSDGAGAIRRIDLGRLSDSIEEDGLHVEVEDGGGFAIDATTSDAGITMRARIDQRGSLVSRFIPRPEAEGRREDLSTESACGEYCNAWFERSDGSTLRVCNDSVDCGIDDYLANEREILVLVREWYTVPFRVFATRIDRHRFATTGDPFQVSTRGAHGARGRIDAAGEHTVVAWDELDREGVRTVFAAEIDRGTSGSMSR